MGRIRSDIVPKRASNWLRDGRALLKRPELSTMIQTSVPWVICLNFDGWVMRAEAEQLIESIKQSVGLLRRHL